VSGYFDNAQDFDKCATILDDAGAYGVYFTLNPVNPSLLARSCNRLKVPKETTQDKDIVCIRWLPIDLDPKRPAGISATDEEVGHAREAAREVANWLEIEIGMSKAICAFSGNGYHLLYQLPDLPNDESTQAMVKGTINLLAGKFTTDLVDVDLTVGNPSRIWKLYGTTGRKGDNMPTRPHRKAHLFEDKE